MSLLAVLLLVRSATPPDANSTLDLPRIAAAALQHAPSAGAARARAASARLQAELQQPSLYPELLVGGRLWAMVPGSPNDSALGTRYRVYSTVRLPLLRLAAARQAGEVVAATRAEIDLDQQLARGQLLRDVGLAYVLARTAQEAEPAHEALCDVRVRQLQVARARLEGGLGTASEVARVEQLLRAAQLLREEARRSRETARARLEALTGLLLHGSTLRPLGGHPCDSAAAARLAVAQRPEVQRRHSEAGRLRAQAQLAWRDAIDLTLGLSASHGTTGTLDDLNGLSALLELRGPLDAPLRARKQMARDLSAARAADAEAIAAAEQVAFEARAACDAYQQALAQVAVQEAQVRYARSEYQRLLGRRALVPGGGESIVEMPQLLEAEAVQREAEARLAEARGRAELSYVGLLLAQGDEFGATSPESGRPAAEVTDDEEGRPGGQEERARRRSSTQPSALLAAAGPLLPQATPRPAVRGLWVWHTHRLLTNESEPAALRAALRGGRFTEVYLSLPRRALANPRLPALVAGLREAGLRVEALFGEANWYLPRYRGELIARIEETARWNRARPTARFDGIHLDIEPHQLQQNQGPNNLGYLPELTATLAAAQRAAAAAGLGLSADLPRKVLRAAEPQQQALLRACPRFFFMLYEMPDRDAIVQAARQALAAGGQVVVGLRSEDHGERLLGVLDEISAALGSEAGYLGWAIHDYDSLRKREQRWQ